MTSHSPFPNITIDDQFILREHMASDAKAFFNYYTHPKVAEFNIAAPAPKNLTEATEEVIYCRRLYYKKQGIYWAIARTDNATMIGAIGLHFRTPDYAEIHYDLDIDYWNRGITTQALKLVIDYSFNVLKLKTIEARTLKANTPSIRVLEKLNFKHDFCLENYQSHDGNSYTIEVYHLKDSTI